MGGEPWMRRKELTPGPTTSDHGYGRRKQSAPDLARRPDGLGHRGVIEWYGYVLGFEVAAGPYCHQADDAVAERIRDLVGKEFEVMRVAFLETGGGAALELFEFDITSGDADASPADDGFFHLGVVDPALEALAARIDETGGDHYADVW